MTTTVLVPSGVLGLGFSQAALERGIAQGCDVIAIDGGSTDSGPHSLGTGLSKYSRAVCKAEWCALMQARAKLGVPLIIGTAGTSGTDSTVDWMYEITCELAAELAQTLHVARLYSGQDAGFVISKLAAGQVTPLSPAPEIDAERLRAMTNIVALAGAEQVQAALETGADIIIAGRTTDTAIIAALPLARGEHPGACWHGAKIAECGALCSTHPGTGVIRVTFDESGFEVEPMAPEAACTSHSVSAHMLYENSDPFRLYEPGGYLDVSAARYKALNGRRVRVEGSDWVSGRYTVKLEGARLVGYQTMLLAILREGHYVANAQTWADKLVSVLSARAAEQIGLATGDFSIELRLIGVSAAMGALETRESQPAEVGALCLITARDQAMADEIGRLANPFLLHMPLTEDEPLPTFAFPYSPAQTSRGAVYEFALNHVMGLDTPMEAFRLELSEVGTRADVA
ncbi:acyclic terpene utilization AtuA family protein [Roseinatronobacter monicus]|uniref:acyclic terpene utilization AtuA family protein n=1 Tax=Roseinatronobacter monicus TaxID=393481 RepID=UPI003F3243CD